MACLAEEKHKPLYAELMAVEGHELIPGGACLNSCRAANYVLTAQGKVGECTYYGSIGKDEVGAKLEKAVNDVNIKGNFYKESGVETG